MPRLKPIYAIDQAARIQNRLIMSEMVRWLKDTQGHYGKRSRVEAAAEKFSITTGRAHRLLVKLKHRQKRETHDTTTETRRT